jgi:ABC-2 type transport system ATP-binding protein
MASEVAALAGVTKCFGRTVALDGLSFTVHRGELLAVLRHNGAGKPTATSLLLGLRRPDRGAVRLFDQPATNVAARRRVGVMMQEVALAPELRVREHVALFSAYYPRPHRCDNLMTRTRTTRLAPGLFGFGVCVATERAQGLFTLKRALPAPRMVYFSAKLVMTALFAQ